MKRIRRDGNEFGDNEKTQDGLEQIENDELASDEELSDCGEESQKEDEFTMEDYKNAFISYMKRHDLKFKTEELEDKEILTLSFELGAPLKSAILKIFIMQKDVYVKVFSDATLPDTGRKNIVEYITRINNNFLEGAFNVNFENGEFSFFYNFPLLNRTLADEQIYKIIYLPLGSYGQKAKNLILTAMNLMDAKTAVEQAIADEHDDNDDDDDDDK